MRIRGRLVASAAVVGLLAGLLVTVATTRPASACSCLRQTDAEAVAAADVVFSGTVDGVRTVGPAGGGPESARVFTVAVDETYKGTTTPEQVVRTPVHSASCGVEVTAGDPVLVFATTDASSLEGTRAGELRTFSCSGTRTLDGPVPDSIRTAAAAEVVDCASAIDAIDRLPPGYRSVAGVVALPVGRTIGVDTTGSPPHFAKVGLAVRTGTRATLEVVSRRAGDAAIEWGSTPPSRTVRVEECVAAGGATWTVFAGGISVDRPRCVPLDVTGTRTVRVRIGVGRACGRS